LAAISSFDQKMIGWRQPQQYGNPLACARTADNLFWRHHIHNAPDRRGDIGVAARGACAAAGARF
jgi:hypothetical protein